MLVIKFFHIPLPLPIWGLIFFVVGFYICPCEEQEFVTKKHTKVKIFPSLFRPSDQSSKDIDGADHERKSAQDGNRRINCDSCSYQYQDLAKKKKKILHPGIHKYLSYEHLSGKTNYHNGFKII